MVALVVVFASVRRSVCVVVVVVRLTFHDGKAGCSCASATEDQLKTEKKAASRISRCGNNHIVILPSLPRFCSANLNSTPIISVSLGCCCRCWLCFYSGVRSKFVVTWRRKAQRARAPSDFGAHWPLECSALRLLLLVS